MKWLTRTSRSDGARISGPGRLGAAGGRTDQPFAESVCSDRGRERPGDGGDRAVEREFSEHAEAFDGVAGDRARSDHQAERNGKVVVAAFFREIGRRKIDGDALRRKPEPNGVERAADALAALGHRLVGKADNGESRNARSDLHLNVDAARLDPLESDRGDPREHRQTPVLDCFYSSEALARRGYGYCAFK